MTNVFLVYSLDDERYITTLRKHLSVFERNHNVRIWYEGKIEAGKNWQEETEAALKNAEVILLIISADSIASDECYAKMQEAFKLHEQGKAKAVPIILRACFWQNTGIEKFTVLPDRELAVVDDRWESDDEPYKRIMKALSPLVDKSKARFSNTPQKLEVPVEHNYEPEKTETVIVKTIRVPTSTQPFYKRFWFGFLAAFLFIVFLIWMIPTDNNNSGVTPQQTTDTKGGGAAIEEPLSYTDERDGQVYPLVRVGGKTWMAKNLVFHDSEGFSLCYENSTDFCARFGRLYSMDVASTVCPKGFHLPNNEEWLRVLNEYGGTMDFNTDEGGNEAYNALVTDGVSNFNAKLGGLADNEGFKYSNRAGFYWTSDYYGNDNAFYICFSEQGKVYMSNEAITTHMSCRCVKDE